jgi:hypothetical protein
MVAILLGVNWYLIVGLSCFIDEEVKTQRGKAAWPSALTARGEAKAPARQSQFQIHGFLLTVGSPLTEGSALTQITGQ